MTKGIFFAVPLALALGVVGSAHATGSADCFKPLKKGTKIEALYTFKIPQGKGTEKLNIAVGGKKKFNGKQATEVKTTTTSKLRGKPATKVKFKSYVSYNVAKKIAYYHGSTVNTPKPFKSVSKTTISPLAQDRFKLRKNQSYTQRTKGKTKTTIVYSTPQGDVKDSSTSTYISKHTKKFLGITTLTVPAGKFEVCKYKLTDETKTKGAGTSKSTSLSWVSTKYGIEVQSKAKKFLSKLKSAKINGKAIK